MRVLKPKLKTNSLSQKSKFIYFALLKNLSPHKKFPNLPIIQNHSIDSSWLFRFIQSGTDNCTMFIMKKIGMALCLCVAMLTTYAQPTAPESNFIKIDQFGYPSVAAKAAVITNPQTGYNASDSFTPGSTYQVREFTSGNVVLSGSPQVWNSGATASLSGDSGWWFDFSSVTAAGTYYVYDVTNNVRSYEFEINNDVYNSALKTAGRMFYYNRCGIEKVAPYAEGAWTYNGAAFQQQDSNCRFYLTPNDASSEKNLTGGWFDAGDFNKYVTFANNPVHDLLWAYRENPAVFGDDWNIPESGNGIPDILDELKWELDWLMKMNNADGSTHIKMGSISYGDNAQIPPDLNTDPRYYGPTCTAASISVAGMFAHAATVFDDFPSMNTYAQDLRNRAETSWNYVLPALNNNQLETTCDDQNVEPNIKAGDADWSVTLQRQRALISAVYLFESTGNNTYNQYVSNNINDGGLPITAIYWDYYNMPINDGLLLYTTLPGAVSTTVNQITNSIQTAVNNNGQDFYGFNPLGDLYRGYLPEYYWGSNMQVSSMGTLNQLMIKYGISPSDHASFEEKALEMAHYIHGVNPQGITYLTNMYNYGGDNCANEMYHNWFADGTAYDNALTSAIGPAPGYLTGGVNQAFTLGGPAPPANQPPQKSYLDYNTGFPLNSWEITEPAIYYQAAYVRLMAFFATANGTSCPLAGTSCNDGDPNTANDVQDGNCNCTGTPIENEDCELITNGDFASDVSDWVSWGCTPTWVSGVASLTNIAAAADSWDVGFSQYNMTLVQGKTYTLTFDASAAASRTIDMKLGQPVSPFTTYFFETLNLTTNMQTFTYTLTMTDPTTTDAGLDFFLGLSSADVYIDNVNLTEVGCSGCELLLNNDFTTDVSGWTSWNCSPISIDGVANLTSITASANSWDAGFSQYNLTLVQGKTYTFAFDASAAASRTIDMKLGLPVSPFTTYFFETIDLTTNVQTFTYTLTMTDPTTNVVGLDFFLGLSSTDVYIDNVNLTEIGCEQNCPTIEILSGTTSTNSTYHAAQTVSSDATIDADVIYKAGDLIELKNGFSTNPANDFSAEIEECSGN